ncbi:MAG: NAD-dependent epimerase/dehydratase family protein [Desulfatibacillaceae bacterium]
MKKKKVFVTGMAGYLGGCLARELDRTYWCGRFHGMDVNVPMAKYKKGEFRQMDINSPALVDWIREIQPDIVVHLAFIVDQVHDETLMHRVNVDGTKNVLRAAREAGVGQVLVASSATAYGAWPDNPVPLKENDRIRAHPTFIYARDKAEVEGVMAEWAKENVGTKLSVIRPCVIYGPNVDNYISGLFTMPLGLGTVGHDPRFQFVHEDDVVGSILHILKKEAAGPFNVAPPDTVSLSEANRICNKPSVPIPDKALEILFKAAWRLRLPVFRVPEPFLDYVRYPWLVDSTRLREELGYEFTYSSRETFEIMLRAKGVLKY